jgi:DNA-binding YbaB/EbfC family protein
MDFSKMMEQVQQMQSRLGDMASNDYRFSVGGGTVVATAKGNGSIAEIRIKPEAIDPEDPETLEDLVLTAVNGALEEMKQAANANISDLTGGLNIPGLG